MRRSRILTSFSALLTPLFTILVLGLSCLFLSACAPESDANKTAGINKATGADRASDSDPAKSAASNAKERASVGAKQPGASGELTVFAAASLNKAFPEIADSLLKDSGLKIIFSFEGSATLVDQLKGGARADVLATADEKNMDKALSAGLVAPPQPFTSNVLTLIVPKGNPGKITGLDHSLAHKKLVVCAAGVPCGNATAKLAKQLHQVLAPVSEEQKVTDVRAKVESGEADAGIVYLTDAKAAGKQVEIIPIPGSEKVINIYPLAQLKQARNPEGAAVFMTAVRSEAGQAILAKYGFRSLSLKAK